MIKLLDTITGEAYTEEELKLDGKGEELHRYTEVIDMEDL